MQTIEVHQYRSLASGPRLLVLGAVHGNETCGVAAIREVAAEFIDGRRRLSRGVLTLVPVANPLAFERGTREGDRNLNRDFRPSVCPETAEDRIANHLAPLLAAHDALLDLHSFASAGEPFVFFGPPDNDGELEPFRRASEEEALSRAIGLKRRVFGWLPAYSRGVARRPGGTIAYGIGTTEYMRSRGGYAVTVECGQHADPAAPGVARTAIDNVIALLRLEADRPAAESRPVEDELIEMCDVFDRHGPDDRFVAAWRSFDRVKAGQPIARRAAGDPVVAPEDGYVVFPNPDAVPGREWFYFAPARPAPVTIDCYRLDLSGSDDRDLALLDPRERARAGRFRFEKDRTRYIAAHAQMRRLLGLRLGIAPERVPISLTRHGKPVVAAGMVEGGSLDTAAEEGPCRFNLSHSGAVGYLAVASCSVGIDVELHRPIEDLQPLIDTYCSPAEIASLAAMPRARRCVGFLGIWTRKEAALKAWGTGIGIIALDQLHVGVDSQTLAGRPAAQTMPGEPRDYPALQLRSLAGAGEVLSVAAATSQAMAVRFLEP